MNTQNKIRFASGGSITVDTPKWLYCEKCGLENDVTENTYQGVVYQRVTKCPSCKYINFDNS